MRLKLKLRSRAFTLLEVAITILLVGIMGTVATFSIHDLLTTHNSAAAIDQFKNLLDELQIEALALGSDMQLVITKKNGHWIACSHTSEKVLRNRTIPLKGVQNITFTPPKPLVFDIYSTGRISPAGVLCFKRKAGDIRIDFQEPLQTRIVK
jgi:prepilin-type N-terminal cleavage/methylation domain-containing protein